MTNEEFLKFIQDSIKELGITDKEIANRFDMSLPSVNRWKNGRNLPHPAMRKHIIEFFNQKRLQKSKL